RPTAPAPSRARPENCPSRRVSWSIPDGPPLTPLRCVRGSDTELNKPDALPEGESLHVQENDHQHERSDQGYPRDRRVVAHLLRRRLAANLLVDQEDHVAAVEDRDWQEVHHG